MCAPLPTIERVALTVVNASCSALTPSDGKTRGLRPTGRSERAADTSPRPCLLRDRSVAISLSDPSSGCRAEPSGAISTPRITGVAILNALCSFTDTPTSPTCASLGDGDGCRDPYRASRDASRASSAPLDKPTCKERHFPLSVISSPLDASESTLGCHKVLCIGGL
eukprot:scaffold166822_cov33-Tisochrysis_lutea.AAC.2